MLGPVDWGSGSGNHTEQVLFYDFAENAKKIASYIIQNDSAVLPILYGVQNFRSVTKSQY